MRTLIVSSCSTPAGIGDMVKAGRNPRIDYLALASQMQADYVDINRFEANTPARGLENKLRMDIRQAFWVAELVRKKGYENVLMMSERIAIPAAHLLRQQVGQVVIGHHLLSPQKLHLIKMASIPPKWDVIVAPTQAEAAALQDIIQPGYNRLELVHFPIDTEFFKPSPNPAPASSADHILSLGLSYRDYTTLIAALKKLPQIVCHLRIGSAWVGGCGDFDRNSLPENVALKPFVPLLELLHCYEKCRFVVIPVRKTSQWSAGSISVLLAQAMGKPVIATKTPGMPDYVLDGETGMLVEMQNPDAMAEAIEYLWRQPGLVEAMGKRARAWVAEMFSLDHWMTRMSEIMNSLERR